MPISGYLGNFEERNPNDPSWQIFFDSIESAFSTFELNENTINPIFLDESHNEETEKFITDVQSAAIEFVADFEQIYNKHIPQFYFSPKQVIKPLSFFFDQKSESSKILRNISTDKIIKNKSEMQIQGNYKDDMEVEDTGLMKTIGRMLNEIKKAL